MKKEKEITKRVNLPIVPLSPFFPKLLLQKTVPSVSSVGP